MNCVFNPYRLDLDQGQAYKVNLTPFLSSTVGLWLGTQTMACFIMDTWSLEFVTRYWLLRLWNQILRLWWLVRSLTRLGSRLMNRFIVLVTRLLSNSTIHIKYNKLNCFAQFRINEWMLTYQFERLDKLMKDMDTFTNMWFCIGCVTWYWVLERLLLRAITPYFVNSQ